MIETATALDQQIRSVLERMTLAEKIGQLALVNGAGGQVPDWLRDAIREGRVGAVLNEVDAATVNELQRVAVEESRLGIPLLIGRDVIHGFKTVFPIPLGQAASWNPSLVERCARVAALEASAAGINWTFAPMIDIGRDPRWGRIAETLGEDPSLSGILAAAMVRGFQGEDPTAPDSLAACAKHFAGYGASESGRDYNTVSLPEIELRNVHLPPFEAALDAGVASVMTSFSEVNGVPATANELLLKQILRAEWGFDGFVVSDWNSIRELSVHGLTADDEEAAYEAARAGVDMEMAGGAYADHLAELVRAGRIAEAAVDAMVANILRIKLRFGLAARPQPDRAAVAVWGSPAHLELAREAALESAVLLKNADLTLPLSMDRLASLAVIGPLADDPYEQLGTWIFDGDRELSRTPLDAIRRLVGEAVDIRVARAMATTRSHGREGFAEAVEMVRNSDAALLFLGEESILSGEAHCRADIGLPGNQEALIEELATLGTPLVLVIMAGRPLALERIVPHVHALVYAWHPGTMAGPALADLLFGVEAPSGKLPVTFPRMTGQIPIYYAHKNTGRPANPEALVHIDDIEPGAPQLSAGSTSFHLDAGSTPLFPFGYGLSYTHFEYRDIELSRDTIAIGDALTIRVHLSNAGDRAATEVAQLYVRDLVGSVTRPVRELKGCQRVRLAPGEQRVITFELHTDDLAFYGRTMRRPTEPGRFRLWIGGSSEAQLSAEFDVVQAR